eukprot:TRINITY_DN12374_c0_g1_i2.p1 TRINITY_DN12374_c0_g1~~TRINITY_DN12374_c0_g1_i2.p1  ORF type:complete len:611 (+),score=143.69 TRINITY_DN12374_c0_g1_i2:1194-3026(+)
MQYSTGLVPKTVMRTPEMGQRTEHGRQLVEYERMVETYSEKIAKLEVENGNLKRKIAELERSGREKDSNYKLNVEMEQNLELVARKLRERVEQYNELYASFQKSEEARLEAEKKAEEAMNEAYSTTNQLKVQLNKANLNYVALNKKNAMLEEEAKSLRAQIAARDEERETLMSRWMKASAMARKEASLRGCVKDLESRFQSTERENGRMREELIKLHAENKILRQSEVKIREALQKSGEKTVSSNKFRYFQLKDKENAFQITNTQKKNIRIGDKDRSMSKVNISAVEVGYMDPKEEDEDDNQTIRSNDSVVILDSRGKQRSGSRSNDVQAMKLKEENANFLKRLEEEDNIIRHLNDELLEAKAANRLLEKRVEVLSNEIEEKARQISILEENFVHGTQIASTNVSHLTDMEGLVTQQDKDLLTREFFRLAKDMPAYVKLETVMSKQPEKEKLALILNDFLLSLAEEHLRKEFRMRELTEKYDLLLNKLNRKSSAKKSQQSLYQEGSQEVQNIIPKPSPFNMGSIGRENPVSIGREVNYSSNHAEVNVREKYHDSGFKTVDGPQHRENQNESWRARRYNSGTRNSRQARDQRSAGNRQSNEGLYTINQRNF